MRCRFALAFLAMIMVAGCARQAPAPSPEEVVARGAYLVAVAGCNDCHTPMTPTGPDMSKSLQGAQLGFAPLAPMPWAPYASALAGGPANYTDEQFSHFLQTGERPSGAPTLPPMPRYSMHAEDAQAVVAYIKTLPAAAD